MKSGAIRRFIVMAGCDGRHATRQYYTDVAKNLPEGTVILQSPAAFSQVSPGSLINVNISSGEDEETFGRSIQLPITLPDTVKDTVVMQCVINGSVVESESLVPADVKVWRPILTGVSSSRVRVTYNDSLYQEYIVDFSTGFYILSTDNSASFKQQD